MKTGFDFSKAGKYKFLSDEAKVGRFLLIDYVIENGAAVSLASAAGMIGLTALDELLASHIVDLDADGNIGHLYPVSAAETGHSVTLADGRRFNTMCAIDSLGCPATFHMDCEISSFCRDTGESVYIKLTENGIIGTAPDIFVSYVDNVGKASCECCGMMSFFRHKENAEKTLQCFADSSQAYLWPLEDALRAARMMFEN